MKLRDMYGQLIAGKGSVLDVQLPQQISFIKERDPHSIALENSINSKMSKAIEQATQKDTKKIPQPTNKVKIVSYEEAIKELSNTLKPTDNKS
jgi:aspartyl/asparaginyl-tRNA synthetase